MNHGPSPQSYPVHVLRQAIGLAPKSYLYVAKLNYRDLPTLSPTHRNIAIDVLIANSSGKGEPGAQVTGWLDIPSADIDPFVGLTDSNGQVVFKALIPRDSQGKFCVVDVSKKRFWIRPRQEFSDLLRHPAPLTHRLSHLLPKVR